MMTAPGRDPMFGRPASRPYAGGTGSTGSGASHDRREREDESGISTFRQEQVLGALRAAGTTGLTWFELGEQMSWHHGQATGALSVLHKDGEIAALADRRKRSTIYVLKEYIAGRPVREPGQTRGNRELADANAELARENGALAQQVADLKVAIRQDLETLAEREGVIANHEARIGEVSERARHAEQQLTLATELAGRLDAERSDLERQVSGLKEATGALMAQIQQMEQVDHAMRVRHALIQMSEDQVALHRRIGDRLAADGIAEAADSVPIRVTLGVLRTLWSVSGRLIPEALPTRPRPDAAASEGSAPAADPGQ